MDALTTLEDIVNSVINRLDEDNSQYERYYQIAIEQLTEFNMLHIKGFNVVELGMDSNHRVKMPDDCMRVLAIGIPYLGRLWNFTQDNNIYRGQSIKNGILSTDSDTPDASVVEQSERIGYSARGGVNEFYYTFDYNERKIIISGTPTTNVTIHYISSGISESGVTYLPLEAKNALVDSIIYNSIVNSRIIPDNQKERAERKFAKSIRKLSIFYKTRTIDQIHDAWLKTLRQTAKR
jgi:hypothetical protein